MRLCGESQDASFTSRYRLLTFRLIGLLLMHIYQVESVLDTRQQPFYFKQISSVENLPIKKIEETDQQPFVALVDQILELKKEGKDTLSLENEIDEMVYRLYDLTDNEIAIVKGKEK